MWPKITCQSCNKDYDFESVDPIQYMEYKQGMLSKDERIALFACASENDKLLMSSGWCLKCRDNSLQKEIKKQLDK